MFVVVVPLTVVVGYIVLPDVPDVPDVPVVPVVIVFVFVFVFVFVVEFAVLTVVVFDELPDVLFVLPVTLVLLLPVTLVVLVVMVGVTVVLPVDGFVWLSITTAVAEEELAEGIIIELFPVELRVPFVYLYSTAVRAGADPPAPAFIALIRKNNPVSNAANARSPSNARQQGEALALSAYPLPSYSAFLDSLTGSCF